MLHKTTKEAYLIDVAIPISHNIDSASTERLQKYADPKELTRIRQMNPVYTEPLASRTAVIILNKLHVGNCSVFGLYCTCTVRPYAESSNTQYMTHWSESFSSTMNQERLVSEPCYLKTRETAVNTVHNNNNNNNNNNNTGRSSRVD